jgi:TM2 domain-containing membrane protein YozV
MDRRNFTDRTGASTGVHYLYFGGGGTGFLTLFVASLVMYCIDASLRIVIASPFSIVND